MENFCPFFAGYYSMYLKQFIVTAYNITRCMLGLTILPLPFPLPFPLSFSIEKLEFWISYNNLSIKCGLCTLVHYGKYSTRCGLESKIRT